MADRPARARHRQRRIRRRTEPGRARRRAGHRRNRVFRTLVHCGSIRKNPRRGGDRARGTRRQVRQGADRIDAAQLAFSAGSQDRCVRGNPQPVHGMSARAGARGGGAAPKGSGALTMDLNLSRVMPVEWEKHDATWIAWPHHEPDWPGKLAPIPWVYAEIVRALSDHDHVEILCQDESVAENARLLLGAHGVKPESGKYRIHLVPTDRVWLRD